mgnify:CR=1 FL=1
MSYELSFGPEFFFAEGEPYDRNEEYTEEEKNFPTSVYMALMAMPTEEWFQLAEDVFGCSGDFLTAETVIDKIRETDSCQDLSSPVRVYIDEEGYYSVQVYDSEEV